MSAKPPLTPKQVGFMRLFLMGTRPHYFEWFGNPNPLLCESFRAERAAQKPGEQFEATIDRLELRDLWERGFMAGEWFDVTELGKHELAELGALA